MVIAIALLFFSLFNGWFNQGNDEAEAEQENENTEMNEEEDESTNSSDEESNEDAESNDIPTNDTSGEQTQAQSNESNTEEAVEDLEGIALEDMTQEQLELYFSYVEVPEDTPAQMNDFFSESNLEATRQIAVAFATNFHSYDKNNPKANVEAIEDYVFYNLYNFWMQTEKQTIEGLYDVSGINQREVVSAEIIEPDTPYPHSIYWSVDTTSNVLYDNGTTGQENVIYHLSFNEHSPTGRIRISDFYVTEQN